MLKTNDARDKRLDEWRKKHPRSRFYFNVSPRYTPGSPAVVDGITAYRVAASELAGYEYALDSRHGKRSAEKARTLGPAGIVVAMRELPRGKGWDILDLITGERVEKIRQ